MEGKKDGGKDANRPLRVRSKILTEKKYHFYVMQYPFVSIRIIYKYIYIYIFVCVCVCVCRQQQWPGCVGSDGGGGGDDGPDLAHVAQLEVPGRLSESLTVLFIVP